VETATQFNVTVGEQEQAVTLEQLGDFEVGQVEEVRGGEKVPEGIIEWKIKEHVLEEMLIVNKDDRTGDKIPAPVIRLEVEVISARNLKDQALDKDTVMGQSHRELRFINDIVKDIGRVKAFLADIGMEASGSLTDLLDKSCGMEFVSVLYHKKDKNDTSKSYAHIDWQAVEPLQPAVDTEVAAAPAIATGGLNLGNLKT